MKRRALWLLVLVLLSLILAGCGNSVKSENELEAELLSHVESNMIEGSSITEFSIIKRLTEEEKKKDTVYVQLTVDHPMATAYQAYIMHYTLYNDGWLLDSIESYQGNDATYMTVPKNNPTNEEIMEQLIAYSNFAIDEYNQTWKTSDPYFFEEGKYAAQICSGNRPSDQTYECIVIANRTYNYLALEETQKLSFVFDLLRYKWVLYNVEIIDESGSWYIDGYWREPNNGATILFEHNSKSVANGDQMDRYVGSCIPKANNTDFSLILYLPTSLGGSGGGLSDFIGGSFEYINCAIAVFPDEILADRTALIPIQLKKAVPALESVGIIDSYIEDESNEYYEKAQLLLNSIFIDSDFTYIESVLHPSVAQGFIDRVNQLAHTEELKVNAMLYQGTQVIHAGDTNWEYVPVATKQLCPDATEIAKCTFTLFITDNGNTERQDIEIMFVKENGQIYALGF